VNDQPIFEVQYVEKRSRLTTFFRYLLAIPHFFVLVFWAFFAEIAVFFAWFAILFTGRYPEGLYNFVAGALRYAAGVNAYVSLVTDAYPPFSGDDSAYPAQLKIPPRLESYSRAKTFFRIILLIPVTIIAYAMRFVWTFGSFLSWIVIVIMGRQPRGLQEMTQLGLSYETRIMPYAALLTESFPAFSNPGGDGVLSGPPSGGGLPAAPSFSAPEAPGGAPRPATSTPPSSGSGLSGGDPLAG
jgi:hypothetical protein